MMPHLRGVDPDEDSNVKVDAHGEKRDDISAIAVGMALNALQHDPQPHLVAALGLERHRPVLCVARLGRVPRQNRHITARATKKIGQVGHQN